MLEDGKCLFKMSKYAFDTYVTDMRTKAITKDMHQKLGNAVLEQTHFSADEEILKTHGKDYLMSIGEVEASPVLLSLFVNGVEWDRSGDKGICHWSQPTVNHRDLEENHFGDMYDSFTKGKLNLANTTYHVSGYAVDWNMKDSNSVDPCYVADSFDRGEYLNNPPIPVPIDRYINDLEVFFKLVTGEAYGDLYPDTDDPDKNDSYKLSMRIFARLIQHLQCRYGGFPSRDSLKEYYELLVTFAFGDGMNELTTKDSPTYMGVDDDSDYATFFRATSFLQQALFPFRICTIDGNHRLSVWLVLAFGGHPKGEVPVDTVIDISTLCVD